MSAGHLFAALGGIVLLLALAVWVRSWADDEPARFALADDGQQPALRVLGEFAAFAAVVAFCYWLSNL